MKGLFVKDLCLNFMNRKNMMIYLFISVFMSFAMDGQFIIGYTTMLLGILAVGTISYDEFDGGMSFLMCLPVTRKDYVREKFLYCLALEILGALSGIVIYALVSLIRNVPFSIPESLPFALFSILGLSLMLYAMIAIQLKYGSEKSRVMMMVIYGVIFALALLLKQFAGLKEAVFRLIGFLDSCPAALLTGLIALFYLAAVTLLYKLSVKTMENKEF
ncbi:MAG: ABC-2 transporter permease [Erysipelotrichaceae bacterium]|nr:ABC-2 transporter permease [Erysipelotrichaceae bacterium]